MDGTLILGWARRVSLVRKDGSDGDLGGCRFKGQIRSKETHASSTMLTAGSTARGKRPANCAYWARRLEGNRHGLIASAMVSRADGHAEREALKIIIDDARHALPHVAQNTAIRRLAAPGAIAKVLIKPSRRKREGSSRRALAGPTR